MKIVNGCLVLEADEIRAERLPDGRVEVALGLAFEDWDRLVCGQMDSSVGHAVLYCFTGTTLPPPADSAAQDG